MKGRGRKKRGQNAFFQLRPIMPATCIIIPRYRLKVKQAKRCLKLYRAAAACDDCRRKDFEMLVMFSKRKRRPRKICAGGGIDTVNLSVL